MNSGTAELTVLMRPLQNRRLNCEVVFISETTEYLKAVLGTVGKWSIFQGDLGFEVVASAALGRNEPRGGGGLSDLNPMRTCTAEQWVTM